MATEPHIDCLPRNIFDPIMNFCLLSCYKLS